MVNKIKIPKEAMIVSTDKVKSIIPTTQFEEISEEKLILKAQGRLLTFDLVKKWEISRPMYSECFKDGSNYVFTGLTWFSLKQIEEIHKIIISLGLFDLTYDIYELKHKKGNFPIILSFSGLYFIMLAPVNIEDAILGNTNQKESEVKNDN